MRLTSTIERNGITAWGKTPNEAVSMFFEMLEQNKSSSFHREQAEAASRLADPGPCYPKAEQASDSFTDANVERLAVYIYERESMNCKTLDDALSHQSKWRRAIPEARAMLEHVFASSNWEIPSE